MPKKKKKKSFTDRLSQIDPRTLVQLFGSIKDATATPKSSTSGASTGGSGVTSKGYGLKKKTNTPRLGMFENEYYG